MKTVFLTLLFSTLSLFVNAEEKLQPLGESADTTELGSTATTATTATGTVAKPDTYKGMPTLDRKFALGLRLGSMWGASLQYDFTRRSRIEVNINFSSHNWSSGSWDRYNWREGNFHSGFRSMWMPTLTAVYHWMGSFSATSGWRWYAGPGAMIGSFNGNFGGGIIGQAGVEYNFKKIPLQLAVDWRPGFVMMMNEGPSFNFAGWAISVRGRL